MDLSSRAAAVVTSASQTALPAPMSTRRNAHLALPVGTSSPVLRITQKSIRAVLRLHPISASATCRVLDTAIKRGGRFRPPPFFVPIENVKYPLTFR